MSYLKQQRPEDSRISLKGLWGWGRPKNLCKLRILYLAKILLKNEGEIKIFFTKKKTKIITSRPACQETTKEVLQAGVETDPQEARRASDVTNRW